MSQVCLFIGRFQPAHYGTVDAIEQIMEAGYDHILFGIGSGDKEFTPDNPLTYTERKEVLASIVNECFPTLHVSYATIPDFTDNDAWFNFIITNLPAFDAIASGNARTQDIFVSHGYGLVDLKIRKIVKASNIRKFIRHDEWDKLSELVPSGAIQILKEDKMTERLQLICPPEKKNVSIHLHITYQGEEKMTELDAEHSLIEHINGLLGTSFSELPHPHQVHNTVNETNNILILHYHL